MLVLSRERDQSIIIGDDVEVRVVDIRGDKVRLGVTAPRQIPVNRKEIADEIRRTRNAPSLVTVIDELLKLIPESETNLRVELQKNRDSARFTPPEAQHERWRQVSATLSFFIGRWQIEVVDAFKAHVHAQAGGAA